MCNRFDFLISNKYRCQCTLVLEEVIEISDDKDDDLAKAIELSLREAHVSLQLFIDFCVDDI